jgi:hypothetical protein
MGKRLKKSNPSPLGKVDEHLILAKKTYRATWIGIIVAIVAMIVTIWLTKGQSGR